MPSQKTSEKISQNSEKNISKLIDSGKIRVKKKKTYIFFRKNLFKFPCRD